jgi:hypothetical protein
LRSYEAQRERPADSQGSQHVGEMGATSHDGCRNLSETGLPRVLSRS